MRKALCVLLVTALTPSPAHAHGLSSKANKVLHDMFLQNQYFGLPDAASDPFTCAAVVEPAVYYNTTDDTVYVCNGTAWTALGSAGGASAIEMNDDTAVIFGTGSDSQCEYDTGQTPDATVCGVGADSRVWWFNEKGDTADYALAQQTNPFVCIHSAADTANQYVCLSHNQTNAVVTAGTGNLVVPALDFNLNSATAAFVTNSFGGAKLTLSNDGHAILGNTNGNTLWSNHTGTKLSRSVEAVTSTKSPAASESHEVYTNEGDADGATVTLPSAVAGYTYTACVQAAQTLTITAASGDTIRVGANVTAAAGSIDSATVGDCVTLVAINTTEWFAVATVGTGF